MYEFLLNLDSSIVLAGGLIFMSVVNFNSIISLVFKYIVNPPGVGKLITKINPKTKQKSVFVKTNIGEIKIPYYKLPSLDMDIYFFRDPSIITENNLISRQAFDELFKKDEFFECLRYDLGIIPQFYSTRDYKGSDRISGFISSILENCVYVFKMEDGIINYKKLLNNYEKSLEGDMYTLSDEKNDMFIIEKKGGK